MKLRDLMAQLAGRVKEYVQQELAPFRAAQEELRKAIEAIPAGKDGAPGRDGKDGARGEKGEPGVRGEKGDPGVSGAPGARGEKGDPGRDGRDASDLKVIEKMVAEQIGTQVGAFIASLRVTSADEGRTLVFEAKAGESTAKHEVRTGLVLDRGIFREGTEYAKGDGVTFGGSWWIAVAEKATDKPGTSDQWRLAVKRGRDGKDAK